MKKTADKIILGILVILMIGISGVLITALTPNSDSKKTDISASTGNDYITAEQAKLIALSAVPGVVNEVELEKENGLLVYEVEITNNNKRTEVAINRETGSIISTEAEEDEEIAPEELKKIGGLITEEQAKQIALDHIGQGNVIDFESEREGGRIIYGVVLSVNGDEVEVEIDAQTGEILEVEWGDDDEDDD